MSYGYSNDLRDCALKYYKRPGVSQATVCDVFGIGERTFRNWLRLEESGDFRCRPHQSRKTPNKIDREALELYIESNPDAYLREIAAEFGVTDVGILYACRRYGITRKKNHAVSGEG